MKLAFLYAGQGAQHAGMGQDLYEQQPVFRAVLDQVAGAMPFDLKTLCFEGPEDQLSQTQYTQPCMVAFATALTAVLKAEGIVPQAAAGLSLGEYSALACADVWDAATAVQLAAFRGKAMAEAVTGRPCGMAAVLGAERDALQKACAQAAAQTGGVVEIANYHCPGQMAIAGDAAAVETACTLAKAAGARRCVPLKVSGPFHTSLMAPAGQALQQKFGTVAFGVPTLPVYFNCLGGPNTGDEAIPDLLVRQVQTSVYWEDLLRRMQQDGIDTMVEIGPGKTLAGLARKTVPGVAVRSVETAAELAETLAWLKGETV